MGKHKIDPTIGINELVDKYPTLIDTLQEDYGFHCVNCIFSEFDTLEEGASLHGIVGEDFEDMLRQLESTLANSNSGIEIYPAD